IGVALLNGFQDALNKIGEHFRTTKMKEIYEKQVALMARFNQPPPPVPPGMAHPSPPGPRNPHHEKAVKAIAEKKGINLENGDAGNGTIETITSPGAQAIQQSAANLTAQQRRKQEVQQKAAGWPDKFTASMMENELDDGEPPTIKLGDASVAAPFT